MKKMISLLLALIMVVGVFAGCSDSKKPGKVEGPETALVLLETVWGLYAEEEKFPVMGGDTFTMDAPGAVTMGGEENPLWNLYVPEDQLANITDAATMIHAMNGNTFTCGAMKLADGADVEAFAQAMRDAIMSTHWMCGFPEKLIVANIGSYVVVAFGLDGVNFPEDGQIITPFVTHLKEAYSSISILFEEEIIV